MHALSGYPFDSSGMDRNQLLQMVNSSWRHHKRAEVYVIRDVLWDSTKDLWAFALEEVGGHRRLMYTRDHEDFFGEVAPGIKRFEYLGNAYGELCHGK